MVGLQMQVPAHLPPSHWGQWHRGWLTTTRKESVHTAHMHHHACELPYQVWK